MSNFIQPTSPLTLFLQLFRTGSFGLTLLGHFMSLAVNMSGQRALKQVIDVKPSGGDFLGGHATPGYSRLGILSYYFARRSAGEVL